jgi:urease accessory protein
MRTRKSITAITSTNTGTGMATNTEMSQESPAMQAASPSTLLRLMWLASPALPVGGFSYSEGLESAVETGLIKTEAQAAAWLLDQLHLCLARVELPVAAQAFDAWRRHDLPRVLQLNDWLRQTRESAELRLQAEQMGRSLVEWLRNSEDAGDERITWLGALMPAPTWPVAFALATALTQASARDALLSFALSWAENMVQAAMKAVPLGQSAAQRVLARLTHEIPSTVDHALELADDERQAYAPMLAILSAQHESQYSRLFRS